jgi:hypothetical protein
MKKSKVDIAIEKNAGVLSNRVLIATPATGLVRMEWVSARYGQMIPTNWSHVELIQYLSSYIPLGFQVADAENLAAKVCVEGNYDWLLFIEHDNVLPPNAFIKLNKYMIKGDIPVVGGLYFTKTIPPEPMIYRKPGHGFFSDWKMGDKVWCRGLPFGCTLIHSSIIKALWKEAKEYQVAGQTTRHVFKHPVANDDDLGYYTLAGTTDLQFCNELITKGIFKKAGWDKFQKKEFPFLVDTSIFVKHIDNEGNQYPLGMPEDFLSGKVTLKSIL